MSQEKMELAERQLARQVASEIVRTMGSRDMSLEQIDDVLQAGHGFMRDRMLSLMDGRGGMTLRALGEIAWALGCQPLITLYPDDQVEEEPVETREAPSDAESQSVETPTG